MEIELFKDEKASAESATAVFKFIANRRAERAVKAERLAAIRAAADRAAADRAEAGAGADRGEDAAEIGEDAAAEAGAGIAAGNSWAFDLATVFAGSIDDDPRHAAGRGLSGLRARRAVLAATDVVASADAKAAAVFAAAMARAEARKAARLANDRAGDDRPPAAARQSIFDTLPPAEIAEIADRFKGGRAARRGEAEGGADG